MASQLLGAIVQQQQALVQQAMSPLPVAAPDAFVTPAPVVTPKAANGAPQIAQILVQASSQAPFSSAAGLLRLTHSKGGK